MQKVTENVISAVQEFVLVALMSKKCLQNQHREEVEEENRRKRQRPLIFVVCVRQIIFKNKVTYISSENLFTTSKDGTPLNDLSTVFLRSVR